MIYIPITFLTLLGFVLLITGGYGLSQPNDQKMATAVIVTGLLSIFCAALVWFAR